MYAFTFAYLVSPVYLHCIVGTFPCFLFSIFFFSRAQKTQKRKYANKLLFSLRCFQAHFSFLFACSVLYFFLVAFLCFWCVRNLFIKNNKGFQTALIISFILLLKKLNIVYRVFIFKYLNVRTSTNHIYRFLFRKRFDGFPHYVFDK